MPSEGSVPRDRICAKGVQRKGFEQNWTEGGEELPGVGILGWRRVKKETKNGGGKKRGDFVPANFHQVYLRKQRK